MRTLVCTWSGTDASGLHFLVNMIHLLRTYPNVGTVLWSCNTGKYMGNASVTKHVLCWSKLEGLCLGSLSIIVEGSCLAANIDHAFSFQPVHVG